MVIETAVQAGVLRSELLRAVQLSEVELSDPAAFLPQRVWKRVWEHAVEQTGRPTLGLVAGQQIDRGYFGVIDYAARSSKDLGTAVVTAQRYFRLANTYGEIRSETVGDEVRFARHIVGDEARELPRQAADFALAAIVRMFRGACTALPLRRVSFRWPAPVDRVPYEDFFACEVHFGALCDAIWIPRSAMSLPMRAPDPSLCTLVQRHGDALLEQLRPTRSVSESVQAQLARTMSRGDATIDQVARDLGMSRRTLQRRLKAEGHRYADLLESLRNALARSYLSAGIPQGEVAFLLGYSDVSTFSRAFRRWTGFPPGSWNSKAVERTDGAT